MFVGVAKFVLEIPDARSLKEKRRVVKSFKDRLAVRLPVSVAEVGDADRHTLATIGVVTVSSDRRRCHETMGAATRMAESIGDAALAAVTTEILPFGSDGRSVGAAWPRGTLSGGPELEEDQLPWEGEPHEG